MDGFLLFFWSLLFIFILWKGVSLKKKLRSEKHGGEVEALLKFEIVQNA